VAPVCLLAEPLALFAAAAREAARVEPEMALRPMIGGREVVENKTHLGLSLRAHPVNFLRAELHRQEIVTCAHAMDSPDGKWLETVGIVLMRQKPSSAKGEMFIAIEDKTGIANLVI
jgi:error-prone DNA polymerase